MPEMRFSLRDRCATHFASAYIILGMRKPHVFLLVGLLFIVVNPVAEAAPKKKCSAKQELSILDLDRRLFSLRKISSEISQSLEINKELLTGAVATNNTSESSRIGIVISNLKQSQESTNLTINQVSSQRGKLLSTCTSKAGKTSKTNQSDSKSAAKCTQSQIELIKTLAQQHQNTQIQIQNHELEIYRQRKLGKTYISQGRNDQAAKANFEIQRRVAQAGDLSAYASIIKRQFEVVNSSCANSMVQLSDLLSKIFVPNSLVSMNIKRFQSVDMSLTRPILSSGSGNLAITCDESSSEISSYSTVGVYFAFTTKKPEIWDRYNGAGIDSDAFTKSEFQPTYLKQPDSTFTLRDFNGNPLTFKGFKAQVNSGSFRDICEFEIVPISPSDYVTNAVGIWYFVIANNQTSSSSTTTIWSLSGFTLQNYLNPVK